MSGTLHLEARGLLCPWPALRLAKAMRTHAGPIALTADDPAAPREITALADAHGWRCTRDGAQFLLNPPPP